MGQGGDDVDGEADEERSDGGIDRSEEREDDGEEPDGDDHRQSSCCSLAQTLAFVHADCFLPHKIQGRACKSKCYELQKK